MAFPQYLTPCFDETRIGKGKIRFQEVAGFLRHVIRRDRLGIAEYLERMGQEPFFLVAATGLGKTVAVPVHMLARLWERIGNTENPQPRIWVVEPRIPIAADQTRFMNNLWRGFRKRNAPDLFGCVTSATGQVNPDAPVKFVTTGIFEQLAMSGELSPDRDRVIIDEAHVTVEQNPGVELAIALARKAGVVVDFMSATVDTSMLEQDLSIGNIIRADRQRYTVWKHNLLDTLEKALPAAIESTLVNPDPSSDYFPQPGEFAEAEEIVQAVLEPGRSHGMLVVVNSFSGEQSDAARLAGKLKKQFPELPVLVLASAVVRDSRQEREFRQRLAAIEAAGQNYVIIATSVVEMGITFPSLDFVATMDSGYNQETIGDVSFPVVAPLSVNALLQRIGRAGRRRPGIAYISLEVGADYAELEDEQLNNAATLRFEPIRFPLAAAPLLPLAYYACTQQWTNLEEWVESLGLPSRLHQLPDRMEYLRQQITILQQLGLATEENPPQLTPLGRRMEQWVGQADVTYAAKLQEWFDDGRTLPELMFWVVSAALSTTPLAALCAENDYFVDYGGNNAAGTRKLDVWSQHGQEDLAFFNVFCSIAAQMPGALFAADSPSKWDDAEYRRIALEASLNGRKLLKAARAISDLWKLFCKINSQTQRFQELFGGQKLPSLGTLPWEQISQTWSKQEIAWHVWQMAGLQELRIGMEPTDQGWPWKSGEFSGFVQQESTPIQLISGQTYRARPLPTRQETGAELSWRLSHICQQPQPLRLPDPGWYVWLTALFKRIEYAIFGTPEVQEARQEAWVRWVERQMDWENRLKSKLREISQKRRNRRGQ